jgi:Cap4 SAVED domain
VALANPDFDRADLRGPIDVSRHPVSIGNCGCFRTQAYTKPLIAAPHCKFRSRADAGRSKLPNDGEPRHAKVKPFLEVRIKRAENEAGLLGLCAGYEAGTWRADGFAKALIRNLPQFALPIEQWENFNTATGVEQLARAARAIYTTNKYQNRGEVGELMLFSIMREHYDSEPIVSN